MPERVFVGLGSNQGNSASTLAAAADALASMLYQCESSSLYRTEPVGVTKQPAFLNAVICGRFEGSPSQLLAQLQEIEQRHGRNRETEVRWGPRSLDLDLLLFGNKIVETELLSVPHREMSKRAFVLVPLLELAPTLADPRDGTAFAIHLESVGREGVYYAGATPYTRGHHASWKNRAKQSPEDISASTTSKDR